MSINEIYEYYSEYSDESFLEILCRSETEPVINGIHMPGFPSVDFQVHSVGSAGSATLRNEGQAFYKVVKDSSNSFGSSVSGAKILDFGCGWGRMIRFFFKDTESKNIYGVDVDPKMISICKETLHYGNYSVVNPHPPTDFPDMTFDIIFAYSVFSHLRDDVAEKWIIEFSRILKNDGILVATTEGLLFLNKCEYLHLNPDKQDHAWHRIIANCFSSVEETRNKYLNGEFIYAATGGGETRDSSFYGEAVVPKAYIENNWGKYLRFRDFFEDQRKFSQSVFIMQK